MLGATVGALNKNVRFDDVVSCELDLNDLIGVIEHDVSDVYASISVDNWDNTTQVGLAICVDDEDNPQNGIFVFMGQSTLSIKQIIVKKLVSGTWSDVDADTFAFSSGAELVVNKNGSEVRVIYNNSLISTNTISDSSAVDNTLHGIFSTNSENTISEFVSYESINHSHLDSYIP